MAEWGSIKIGKIGIKSMHWAETPRMEKKRASPTPFPCARPETRKTCKKRDENRKGENILTRHACCRRKAILLGLLRRSVDIVDVVAGGGEWWRVWWWIGKSFVMQERKTGAHTKCCSSTSTTRKTREGICEMENPLPLTTLFHYLRAFLRQLSVCNSPSKWRWRVKTAYRTIRLHSQPIRFHLADY